MKLQRIVSCLAAAIAAACALGQTILPDLGAGGIASALNDRGTVVGVVLEPDTHLVKPAVWVQGRLSLLGTGSLEQAHPLNLSPNGRFAVGKAGNIHLVPGGTPVRWDETGALQVLPDLGFGGVAYGVNDEGVAVGVVYAEDYGARAARWSAQGALEILTPVNAQELINGALDINSSGHIVGYSHTEPHFEAAVKWGIAGPMLLDDAAWFGGRVVALAESNAILALSVNRTTLGQTWFTRQANGNRTDLVPLDPTLHFSARDLNSAQNVVGFGSVPNGTDPIRIRAAMWIGGQPTLLPVPNESMFSFAEGVNEAGGVAGFLYDGETSELSPVVWNPIEGAGIQLSASPVRGFPGQTVVMRATYKEAGRAKPGVTIRFMAADRSSLGQARTNAAGIAELRMVIPASAPAGRSEYMASLGGNRVYRGTFEVDALPTQILPRDTGGIPGQRVLIGAVLRNRITGAPIVSQIVRVQSGNLRWSLRTNAQGLATVPFTIPRTARPGDRLTFDVAYAGNVNHARSSARVIVRVR